MTDRRPPIGTPVRRTSERGWVGIVSEPPYTIAGRPVWHDYLDGEVVWVVLPSSTCSGWWRTSEIEPISTLRWLWHVWCSVSWMRKNHTDGEWAHSTWADEEDSIGT